jgi:hypothetical protein
VEPAASGPVDPAALVQRQLDAYNAHDLARFVACYAKDVELFRPPAAEPFIVGRAALAEHYGSRRFNIPTLQAELVGRLVVGQKVFDHERITGLAEQPVEALVAFETQDGSIRRVWFFDA